MGGEIVDDPELEQRRKTGRWVMGLGIGAGCVGFVAMVVMFLAIWQFLAPTERTVPPRPRSASPPASASE